jgi:hypothetical protein
MDLEAKVLKRFSMHCRLKIVGERAQDVSTLGPNEEKHLRDAAGGDPFASIYPDEGIVQRSVARP